MRRDNFKKYITDLTKLRKLHVDVFLVIFANVVANVVSNDAPDSLFFTFEIHRLRSCFFQHIARQLV